MEIDKNSPEILGNSVQKLDEYNKFNLSISKIIFSEKKNIIIISFSNSEGSLLNSLFNEFKNDINKGAIDDSLGMICIYEYKIETNDNLEQLFNNKLWEKSFSVVNDIIIFEENKEFLCLGNENGEILIYKPKNEGNFTELELYAQMKFHTKKISGIYFDIENMNIFSTSYDNSFLMIDIKDKNDYKKTILRENESGYTNLIYDKEKNIFITTDIYGIISIFGYENSYIQFCTLQTSIIDKINMICLFQNSAILGGKNGRISLIDISLAKDKKIKELYNIDIGLCNICSITCNNKNGEIIIGDENGRIIICSQIIRKIIYIWEGHQIEKINFLNMDKNNNLWSCGNEKKKKKWKLPYKWFKNEIYLYLNLYNYDEENDNLDDNFPLFFEKVGKKVVKK